MAPHSLFRLGFPPQGDTVTQKNDPERVYTISLAERRLSKAGKKKANKSIQRSRSLEAFDKKKGYKRKEAKEN